MKSLPLLAACSLVALALGSCGGGGGGGGSGAADFVVSGAVTAPGGVVANFTRKDLLDRLAELLVPAAFADVTGLAAVLDGTGVSLIRIDGTGAQTALLASTTTRNGKYSFDLTAIGAGIASNLAVQVTSTTSGAKMRAFVTSSTVNIDPMSEAAVKLVLDSIAANPGETLANFTTKELDDLSASARLVLALQNPAAGVDIPSTVAAFETAAAVDPNLSAFLTAAAAPGQTTSGPGDVGNYFPLTQGSTWTYGGLISNPAANYQNVASIPGTQTIGSVLATIYRETNPGNNGPLDTYLLKTTTDVSVYGNNDPTDPLTPAVAPFRKIVFPLKKGATFEQFSRTGLDFGSDVDGDGKNETFDVVSTVTVFDFLSVSVASTSYPNTFLILTDTTLTVHLSASHTTVSGVDNVAQYFAPGVGKVASQELTNFGDDPATSVNTAENLTASTVMP